MKDNFYYFTKELYLKNNCLYSVEIDVTNRCNSDCIFCFQGSRHYSKKELNIKEYSALFYDLKMMGCYYIGFSGGEPFLRSDLLEIISLAKDYGFRVSLISNGSLVTFKTLDKLKEIGLDRLSFSLHSLDEETNKNIFGNQNISSKHTIELIKYSLSIGLNIGVCLTITNQNVQELDNYVSFFERLGLIKEKINLNQLAYGKKDISQILPNIKDIKCSKRFLMQERETENEGFSFMCSAGKISCSIDPCGNVYPCSFLNCSAGNIRKNSIKDIWENSHLLQMFRSFSDKLFEKCLNCNIKNKCHVCYANNIATTGNIFESSDERCNYLREIQDDKS